MRVIAEAVFDGVAWLGSVPNRGPQHAAIVVEEFPRIGELVEGRLASLIDEDSYVARRLVEADTFGGQAYLVIGKRAPPSRPT